MHGTVSVSSHPLFPAIVALWFGALLGLGSLAIRASLIEAVIGATHLDKLIPAAAPPLGMTGRILVALGLAALGALMGAVLARRLTRVKPVERARKRTLPGEVEVKLRARDSHPDAPARRPISAFEEFAEVPADESLEVPSRRRALLSEYSRNQEFRDSAPLPGGTEPMIDAPTAAFHHADFAPAAAAAKLEDQPVWDLGGHEVLVEDPVADFAPIGPIAEAPFRLVTPDDVVAAQVEEPAMRQVFGAPAGVPEFVASPDSGPAELRATQSFKASAAPLMALAAQADAASDHPLLGKRLDELGPVQLIERLALSLDRRRARSLAERQTIAVSEVAPLRFLRTEAEDDGVNELPTMDQSAARWEESEPIALAEAPGYSAAVAFDPLSEPEPEPERARIDFAAPLAPMAMPSAFRPLGFGHDDDDEDDEDAAVASLLPPRNFRFAVPVVDEARDDEPELARYSHEEPDPGEALAVGETEPGDNAAEDGYSSLLDLPRPVAPRPQFIRIDEPQDSADAIEPVVIFPGQAPALAASPDASGSTGDGSVPSAEALPIRRFDAPLSQPATSAPASASADAGSALDREETERALRAALATLQRMSGAA